MGVFTTASKTWAVGNKITAALVNTHLRNFRDGFDAKTSYTPTLTGFTQGNGTISGSYTQIGKWVWFEVAFTMGTTSAAASAIPTVTLPVTAAAASVNAALCRAQFTDAGTAAYLAAARILTTTTCGAYIIGSSGILTTPSTTTPFTWTPASGDNVYWSGVYEAA
jgi:hypothetical protein